MSSIIKGERIRNQSIINLSERFKAIHIEYEKAEIEDEAFKAVDDSAILIREDEVSDKEETVENHLQQENTQDEILREAREMANQIIAEAKQFYQVP